MSSILDYNPPVRKFSGDRTHPGRNAACHGPRRGSFMPLRPHHRRPDDL